MWCNRVAQMAPLLMALVVALAGGCSSAQTVGGYAESGVSPSVESSPGAKTGSGVEVGVPVVEGASGAAGASAAVVPSLVMDPAPNCTTGGCYEAKGLPAISADGKTIVALVSTPMMIFVPTPEVVDTEALVQLDVAKGDIVEEVTLFTEDDALNGACPGSYFAVCADETENCDPCLAALEDEQLDEYRANINDSVTGRVDAASALLEGQLVPMQLVPEKGSEAAGSSSTGLVFVAEWVAHEDAASAFFHLVIEDLGTGAVVAEHTIAYEGFEEPELELVQVSTDEAAKVFFVAHGWVDQATGDADGDAFVVVGTAHFGK